MSKFNDSQLAMFKGTYEVLIANKEKTDTISAMNENIEALGGSISAIESYRQAQLERMKGPSQERTDTEEKLILMLLPAGSAMYSYGKKIGDSELCVRTNHSESQLRSMRQADLLDTSKLYVKLAKERAAGLSPYGLSAAKIAALEAQVEAYATALKKRHSITAEAAGFQKAFSVHFAQGNEVLRNHLDKLMEQFRESDPVFYRTYRKARVKRSVIGRHKPVPETAPGQEPVQPTPASSMVNPPPDTTGKPATTAGQATAASALTTGSPAPTQPPES
jgi:hypothetical protein